MLSQSKILTVNLMIFSYFESFLQLKLISCLFSSFTEQKLPPGQNPDEWTIREKLTLASSVVRSGDQNWWVNMAFFASLWSQLIWRCAFYDDRCFLLAKRKLSWDTICFEVESFNIHDIIEVKWIETWLCYSSRVSVSRTIKPVLETGCCAKPRPPDFFSQKVIKVNS